MTKDTQPEARRLADKLAEEWAENAVSCETVDAVGEELRRLHAENEALRKDAERWNMVVLISEECMKHPNSRKNQTAVSAYMKASGEGFDITFAINAAIDAAMQATK